MWQAKCNTFFDSRSMRPQWNICSSSIILSTLFRGLIEMSSQSRRYFTLYEHAFKFLYTPIVRCLFPKTIDFTSSSSHPSIKDFFCTTIDVSRDAYTMIVDLEEEHLSQSSSKIPDNSSKNGTIFSSL